MRQAIAGVAPGVSLAWLPAPAGAQGRGIPVRLEGITVLHVRASAGGYSPAERHAQLRERFAAIVQDPNLTPRDVEVEVGPDERTATVWVGQRLFVTATEADARANDAESPEQLAREWARNLRRAYERARERPEAWQ